MQNCSTAIADSGSHSLPGRFIHAVVLLASCVLLMEACYFLITGILQIVNFGWRQPMFDQYKMYPNYLEFAFPENVIQLENGHRPLLPILITLAEIRWLGANQILQIAVGTSCAFMMAAIPATAAWRQPSMSMPMRAAAVAIASIGIFWLGNSRMLLHGNELLHVYLPGMLVLLAALCAHRASFDAPVRWMIVATVLCTGAMFCFGAGVAAFPAIALVAWLSKVPLRAIAMLVFGLGVSLVVYLFVLPGDDGVRQMLELRPVDSMATAARWIGSPWVNAWLGFADPSLYPWMRADVQSTWSGAVLANSANAIQKLFGNPLRMTGSLILGLGGFLMLTVILMKRLFRRGPVSAVENIALTMAVFGAAISVLIGIGRLAQMIALPEDIFADRYLPWSCTFWIGITILALRRLDRARQVFRLTTVALVMAVPWLLLPSHRSWAGWGEAVYKNSQASAAAAMSDVFDSRVFPDDASAANLDVLRTLALLRKQRLAMFAAPSSSLLGASIPTMAPERNVAVTAFGVRQMRDAFTDKSAATFDALVTDEISWVRKQGPMVVLDSEDRIRGFALPSFVNGKPSDPRINLPRKRGYTGYIANYRETEEYRLALLNPGLRASTVLTFIPTAE